MGRMKIMALQADLSNKYETLFEMKNHELGKISKTRQAAWEYIWMQGQMPYLDPGNVLILKNQMPGARDVKTYDEWKRAGYSIKNGERALKIFSPRPNHKKGALLEVLNVFDITQTTRSYTWAPICDLPRTHLVALVLVAGVELAQFKKITPNTKNVAYLEKENTLVVNPYVDDELLMLHATENAIYRLREKNQLTYFLQGDWETRVKSAHFAAQIYIARYGFEDPIGQEESLTTLSSFDLKEREELLIQARSDFVAIMERTEALFPNLAKKYPLKDERGLIR